MVSRLIIIFQVKYSVFSCKHFAGFTVLWVFLTGVGRQYLYWDLETLRRWIFNPDVWQLKHPVLHVVLVSLPVQSHSLSEFRSPIWEL
jgi:hypothetical protein